jgi:hypothetical protein
LANGSTANKEKESISNNPLNKAADI